MRKLATAVLAVPVLVVLYLPILARRAVVARMVAVASLAAVVVVVAGLGLSRPTATRATEPAPPITALADDAFRAIDVATDLHAAVRIRFSEPMDAHSVTAALSVNPPTAVRLTWNAATTELTVQPAANWAAGTYHTITVAPGALAAGGRPMANALRAVFVTRPTTTGRIAPDKVAGKAIAIASTFRITFDRPVTTAALAAAIRVTPDVTGRIVPDTGRANAVSEAGTAFTFVPASGLAAGTTYRIELAALVDVDGAPVGAIEPMTVRTWAAPRVIRFRPADGAAQVARTAALSVRFSQAMNPKTTRTAIEVLIAGKRVAGTIRFAEGNTVAIFQPSAALPAATRLTIRVQTAATSAQGARLGAQTFASFTTVRPPAAPKPVVRPTSGGSTPTPKPTPTGGGAVGGGSWGAVESYYLRLMNCTRTGGWVTSTGSCSSPGGRNVAPLKLDAGISSKVSRPYAKKLAVGNICNHFIGGTPGDRLSAAGYTSYRWAENLGCRSGNPYSAVLGSHLYFQSEKPYLGGHYVNLMNSAYDRCGIGVWVSGGRVRLVIDFYHPR